MAPAWHYHIAVYTLLAVIISTLRSMARFGLRFSMYFYYALLLPLQLCHPIHTLQREWLDFGWFASHTFHQLLILLDFTIYLTYDSVLIWPISAREIIVIFTEIFKYCTYISKSSIS